jgi:UDP-glucose 4-epimerase
MRVLVTGGAGYIGSVTVAELLARGHDVIVYDNLEKGHRDAVPPGAGLIVDDLAKEASIEKTLREFKIEAVIHFAGYSLVGESMEHPERYFVNNVGNGLNLLQAMRRAGTGRIVFSSSAAVYGAPERVPIGEDHPASPINPYGESKLYFESILDRYHHAYGMDYVSLRYFNAAGASEEYGEDHTPETHLIPSVLKAALGQTESVKVFGSDYATDDGTCVRDYIHVSDLAEAHVVALACRGARVYNLGDGKGYSVREVVETARKVTGKAIREQTAPRRPGDPAVLIASPEKIKRELGWAPRRVSLEEIIESAWRWMKGRPGGYNVTESRIQNPESRILNTDS